MHHALTISEIVHEIFSYLPGPTPYLEVYPDGGTNHKSLAALAVTCRAFLDPALAVRWRRLCGLKPFIVLFPNDI
ncbi:hypothetical protein BJ138DRAFT_991961, partial [Hygrophoropsis aurantiaca]